MNPFAIAGILTGISSIIFGFFVYIKNPKRALNKIWFIFTLAVAWWGLGVLWIATSKTAPMALLAWKIAYVGIPWIAVLFLHFVNIFLDLNKRKMVFFSYGIGFFFSILAITPYFHTGTRFVFDSFYYTVVQFYFFIPFLIWWLGTIIYSHYLLLKAFHSSPKPKQFQIKFFFLGTLTGFAGGSLAYLPTLGIDLYPWGTFTIPLYPIIMTHAIIQYQLMDIKVVIKKAFFYSLGIAAVSGVITAISLLNDWFVSHIAGFRFWFIPLFSGVITVIVGKLFWNKSKEADKLKYEFITVAAHKLRTPLTEIKWMVSELLNRMPQGKDHDLALKVNAANNRLVELANVLLETSKAEGETYLYHLEPVDVVLLAEQAFKDLKPQSDEKGITISINKGEHIPQVTADKGRITTVIQILLENAITYTPRGGTVDIVFSRDGTAVRCSVSDSGIGIPKEEMPYIFEKFFRGHRATLTHTEGNGLGLFIAKTIIDRHGGAIGAESEGEDQGSRFWFSLRAA